MWLCPPMGTEGEPRLGEGGGEEGLTWGGPPGVDTSIEDGRAGDMSRGQALVGDLALGEGLPLGVAAAPSGEMIRGEDGALLGVTGAI